MIGLNESGNYVYNGKVYESIGELFKANESVKRRLFSSTSDEFKRAREYWDGLSDEELVAYWIHYTKGKGKGSYTSVGEGDSFEEYMVNSAWETAFERRHDI